MPRRSRSVERTRRENADRFQSGDGAQPHGPAGSRPAPGARYPAHADRAVARRRAAPGAARKRGGGDCGTGRPARSGRREEGPERVLPQLNGTASYTRTLKSQFGRAGGSGGSDSTATTSCNRFTADPSQPVTTRLDSLENALNCLSRLNPFAAFGNLPFGQKNQYNLGLYASQIVFAGGRIRAQTRAARLNRSARRRSACGAGGPAHPGCDPGVLRRRAGRAVAAIARAHCSWPTRPTSRPGGAAGGSQPEFDVLRAPVSRDNQRTTVIQREADRVGRISQAEAAAQPAALRRRCCSPPRWSTACCRVCRPRLAGRPAPDTATAIARPGAPGGGDWRSSRQQRLKVAKAERFPAVTLSSTFSRLGYPSDLLPAWAIS